MKERAEVTDTDASQSRNALSNRIHNKIKNPKSDTNRKRHPPPLLYRCRRRNSLQSRPRAM